MCSGGWRPPPCRPWAGIPRAFPDSDCSCAELCAGQPVCSLQHRGLVRPSSGETVSGKRAAGGLHGHQPGCSGVCSSVIATFLGLNSPGGSDGKECACNAGDLGPIPGSGRSSGEGNGNPLQASCLENPMDRGAWQAKVHGVANSRT